MTASDVGWTTSLRVMTTVHAGAISELRLGVTYAGAQVRVDSVNIRRGSIGLYGHTYGFALVGFRGTYGLATQRTYFDLNGDGSIDMSQNGMEWVYNREGSVSLGGKTFEFRIDPAGSSLTLSLPANTPSAAPRVRARLIRGKPAPGFQLRDVDGKVVDSRTLLGRRVVLAFWSMSCPPCIAELPELETVQLAMGNVVVVGITPDVYDSSLREFIDKLTIKWMVMSVPMGKKVYTDYLVDRFPTHVLIDEDGNLVCAGCTLGEIRTRLMTH